MKNLIRALLICTFWQLTPLAQLPGQTFPPGSLPGSQAPAEELPKFDIEFPGGTPGHLVELIQLGLDTLDKKFYINVIIPEEFQEREAPAAKNA